MHVYQIQYQTGQDNTQWTAGILADTKIQALEFLKQNVRDFRRLQGTSKSNIEVQAITDDIIDRVLAKYDVERPTQDELYSIKQYYQDKLESLENKNKELQLQLDKMRQQSNNDIDESDAGDIL